MIFDCVTANKTIKSLWILLLIFPKLWEIAWNHVSIVDHLRVEEAFGVLHVNMYSLATWQNTVFPRSILFTFETYYVMKLLLKVNQVYFQYSDARQWKQGYVAPVAQGSGTSWCHIMPHEVVYFQSAMFWALLIYFYFHHLNTIIWFVLG